VHHVMLIMPMRMSQFKQAVCKEVVMQMATTWQFKSRGQAQSGNRAGKTECCLQ